MAKERNALDDSKFGVPELRKYPLTDPTHVTKAEQFFKHCPEQYKPKLRRNINKARKKFGMDKNKENED